MDRARRRLAKAAFWLGGELCWLKVPQRYWTWHGGDDDFGRKADGWHRIPALAYWLALDVSRKLDPVHWEHWACENAGEVCAECGGYLRCVCAQCSDGRQKAEQ